MRKCPDPEDMQMLLCLSSANLSPRSPVQVSRALYRKMMQRNVSMEPLIVCAAPIEKSGESSLKIRFP